MASFDANTFLNLQGNTGADFVNSVGGAFGVPSCLLNLGANVFSILPTSVLLNVQSQIIQGRRLANDFTASLMNSITLGLGIVEFDTETGQLVFKSPFGDTNSLQALQDMAGFLGAIQSAASFGAQLYANYQDIEGQINDAVDCIDKAFSNQKAQSGGAAYQQEALSQEQYEAYRDQQYGAAKQQLQEAAGFITAATSQLDAIAAVLAEREANPDLEPCFSDSSEFDNVLFGTSFKRCPVVDPGLEVPDQKEVFRLTYGPPVSKVGQYILSQDGLYYDSRSGGLDPVYLSISGTIAPGDKWRYDYDPNLGGKGDIISLNSINKFTDNVFDPDIIDDSAGLQTYYDKDHFLAVLRQQRDKHAYDLSGELQTYIDAHGADSAIVKNQREVIISEIANHNSKVDRRKKQIEVAIKIPQIYGNGEILFPPGEVPINDFSFLEQYNLLVDLEKQKALAFSQGELVGMVLPVQTKFVGAAERADSLTYSHLNVPDVGVGGIIYSASGDQGGTMLSLTDHITTDGLFAIYNFLETTVTLPSSLDFETTNCATADTYNNAQMMCTNTQDVFFSGLGIPYLAGITKNKSTYTAGASALGSAVRLPDTKEFQELTYNPSGFTFECWVHVPNITQNGEGWQSTTTSALTKVLLGCENVGNTSSVSALDHLGQPRELDALRNSRGGDFVRGMICGFTRDRRITQASATASNNNADNDCASSLSFFIAPTQARDGSSASWINKDECENDAIFYKMEVDLHSNPAIGNVSSQFVLVDVAVDPQSNEISMYADGTLLATSALTEVFGNEPGVPPSLPTFRKPNSFEYSDKMVDGPDTLKTGPKLNEFYTPWVVGGGYTDGMYLHGNFMGGGANSGIVSGLRGHVGSMKFYSKPLNNNEVLANYNAQKGFFKGIEM